MLSSALEVSTSRFERMLLVPRAVLGVGLLVLPPVVSDLPRPVMMLAGLALVLVSLVAGLCLYRGDAHPRWWVVTSAADAGVAVGVVVALGATESSPAVLLLPLVGFELALKHGLLGAGLAVGGLALAMTGRAVYRAYRFDLPPRAWLITVMLALAGLLVAVAGAVRVAEHRRNVADRDRVRLAALLRSTVEAVLTESGRRPDDARHRDLRDLVELACDRPELGSEVARRLAAEAAPRPIADGPLSARELEVLELVGAGLTDKAIAAQLFLSPGTIRVHVSHAVHKLGVADRAAAVSWVRQRNQGAGSHTPT